MTPVTPVPGLIVYRPTTENSLVPTLEAARDVGVRNIVCIDGVLRPEQVKAMVKDVFGGTSKQHRQGRGHLIMAERGDRFLASVRLYHPSITQEPKFPLADEIKWGVFAPHSDTREANVFADRLREEGVLHAGAQNTTAQASKILESTSSLKSHVAEHVVPHHPEFSHASSTIEGESYSVEGFFHKGQANVSAVHWIPNIIENIKTPQRFIEIGCVTIPNQCPEFALLASAVQYILASVPGLNSTTFHAKFKIDSKTGKVLPIEIRARPGENLIPQSSYQFSGVNLYDAGVRMALGQGIVYPSGPHRISGTTTFAPTNDGAIKRSFFRIPGFSNAIELIPDNERDIVGRLNRWLPTVPRADAESYLHRLQRRAPFHSEVRQNTIAAFNPTGNGLNVRVMGLHSWVNPGDPAQHSVGTRLGNMLLTSEGDGVDMATFANTVAALNMVLSVFESEAI